MPPCPCLATVHRLPAAWSPLGAGAFSKHSNPLLAFNSGLPCYARLASHAVFMLCQTLSNILSLPQQVCSRLVPNVKKLSGANTSAGAAPCAAVAEVGGCPGNADGQSGQAVQAACAAKRWLARNAACITRIRSETVYSASACMSLVSCLPTLEHVALYVDLL